MSTVRSILFNVLYYGSTAMLAIVLIPALVLPEALFWRVIRSYFYFVYLLEKYVLGLDYRVIGQEHLPQDGRFIVAAKHQSAYETLKLPLLFDRPTVILKQELLNIPFWGWYAKKAGMIGINRDKPRAAMAQMAAGVRQAAETGRTVVIFPQGTRVGVDETAKEKPYKRGIAELYAETGLPVVPLVLNAGLFWPRNAFLKRGGLVTLEFLPVIPPGLDRAAFMPLLEQQLEQNTGRLIAQGQKEGPPS